MMIDNIKQYLSKEGVLIVIETITQELMEERRDKEGTSLLNFYSCQNKVK